MITQHDMEQAVCDGNVRLDICFEHERVDITLTGPDNTSLASGEAVMENTDTETLWDALRTAYRHLFNETESRYSQKLCRLNRIYINAAPEIEKTAQEIFRGLSDASETQNPVYLTESGRFLLDTLGNLQPGIPLIYRETSGNQDGAQAAYGDSIQVQDDIQTQTPAPARNVCRRAFGAMPDGTPVEELILHNGALSCGILTYGGAVRTLSVPDRNGNPTDIVLGFDTLEDYMKQDKYIGALIGRYANRIGGSSFVLNDKEYILPANEGKNHLHGGLTGFDKQVWTVEALTADTLTLSLCSPDGQEGYPGTLSVKVTYSLTDHSLELDYQAESDQDTLCNLTSHMYFNLSGHASGPVAGQEIQILSGFYTPVGKGSIPSGKIAPVSGTPMDLRVLQSIGKRIDEDFRQLNLAGGYDHNWIIDRADGTLRKAAAAYSPAAGIYMDVLTTMPGIQFYSGNYIDGAPAGKDGVIYGNRHGFCLETQFFPDSPHHPNFPDAVLHAGAPYHHMTQFCFHTD